VADERDPLPSPEADHRTRLLVSMDNFYLPPLPHAVGVIPAMCTHEDTAALRVHETLSWTGDDYTIDNALTGEPVLRVKGHVASLRGRKGRSSAAFLEIAAPIYVTHAQTSRTPREHLSSSCAMSYSHFVALSLRALRARTSCYSRSNRNSSP
jgi:hypothetical protein